MRSAHQWVYMHSALASYLLLLTFYLAWRRRCVHFDSGVYLFLFTFIPFSFLLGEWWGLKN
jgi:hypothetical protein